MHCSNCGAKGAAEYVRRTDGREVKISLCPSCYSKLYGGEDDNDFFTSFLGNVGSRKEKSCPSCGTTLADFRRTGLLGCARCYTEFREELTPAVRYVQGKVRHEGKRPSEEAGGNYDLVRQLVCEQEKLKSELEHAIREGNFYAAEKLKARLKEINRRLYGGGDAR